MQNLSTAKRATLLLVLMIVLAGCSTAAAPPMATQAVPTTPPAEPTALPPVAPTALPPAPPTSTPLPLPTSLPEPTAAPPTAVPPTEVPAEATPVPPPPPPTGGSAPAEILFLRGGTLIAHNPATGQERTLADGVSDVDATPDGRILALVRQGDIYLMDRASGTMQLAVNTIAIDAEPSLAGDGSALVYTVSTAPDTRPTDWATWTAWCRNGVVQVLDLRSGTTTTIGNGCNPAFATDSKRIAYISPPAGSANGVSELGTTNALVIVNRQGANGWNFATAAGDASSGLAVYTPAWSPQSGQLAFNRFIGYQALADVNYTEMGNSYAGPDSILGQGAGWLQAPRFSPDGSRMLLVQYNYADARGWGGYETWQTQVWRIGVQDEMLTPSGTIATGASVQARLARATNAAWSPDGQSVVLSLPAGWSPEASTSEPLFTGTGSGELWLWQAGANPTPLGIGGVDYASPLLWLPAS